MNNQTALVIAFVLALGLLADWFLLGGQVALFLGRQWLSLLTWLAVWR